MKTIIVLFFISSFAFCQDITYIKTLDTILVNFRENKLESKVLFPVNNFGFQDRWYTFNFEDRESSNTKQYLRFWYSKYPSSERRDMNIKSDFRIVKKSYLKKNKKRIISIDFFKKYGIYRSTYEAFEKCSVIYIIDNSESKNGLITLYEVTKGSSYVMGE